MRRLVCCFLVILMLFCGCSGKTSGGTAPDSSRDASPAPTSSNSVSSLLQETRSIAESGTLSDFSATSGLLPHHILSILPGVTLTADDLALDKVDNGACVPAEESLFTGSEALIYADSASVTLTNSIISATAPYAHGLFLDSGCTATLVNSALVTTGIGQSAVAASGSSLSMKDCILASTGNGAFCLLLLNSFASAEGTELSVREASQALSMFLDSSSAELTGCTVSGNLQYGGTCSLLLSDTALNAELFSEHESSELSLALQSGSVLTGCSYDDCAMNLLVTLDESSTWSLTEDSFVARLSDEDTGLANIQSNGYSLYYNSEYEGNEWLESRTLSLPGGGYLIPLI